jgi:hypothetical protein
MFPPLVSMPKKKTTHDDEDFMMIPVGPIIQTKRDTGEFFADIGMNLARLEEQGLMIRSKMKNGKTVWNRTLIARLPTALHELEEAIKYIETLFDAEDGSWEDSCYSEIKKCCDLLTKGSKKVDRALRIARGLYQDGEGPAL